MPDGCAMRCASCCPASVHVARQAATGRRIFVRWFSFTKNCSGDRALPEADRDVAGSEAQPEIHAVSPLIVILEIGAVVVAGDEAEDAVSQGRQLAAGTYVGRVTSVLPDHVTLGDRAIVVSSGRQRPAAYTSVVIPAADVGCGGSQEQPIPGIEPVGGVDENRAPGYDLGEPGAYVRDVVCLVRHALGVRYPDHRGDRRIDRHDLHEYVLIPGSAGGCRELNGAREDHEIGGGQGVGIGGAVNPRKGIVNERVHRAHRGAATQAVLEVAVCADAFHAEKSGGPATYQEPVAPDNKGQPLGTLKRQAGL